MPAMALPSLTSRTSPTKVATAPTLGLPARSLASSAETSKSSVCTRIISAPGHRREESDSIASFEPGIGICHYLVHCHAHVAVQRQRPPLAAARNQLRRKRADAGHTGIEDDLLGAAS